MLIYAGKRFATGVQSTDSSCCHWLQSPQPSATCACPWWTQDVSKSHDYFFMSCDKLCLKHEVIQTVILPKVNNLWINAENKIGVTLPKNWLHALTIILLIYLFLGNLVCLPGFCLHVTYCCKKNVHLHYVINKVLWLSSLSDVKGPEDGVFKRLKCQRTAATSLYCRDPPLGRDLNLAGVFLDSRKMTLGD